MSTPAEAKVSPTCEQWTDDTEVICGQPTAWTGTAECPCQVLTRAYCQECYTSWAPILMHWSAEHGMLCRKCEGAISSMSWRKYEPAARSMRLPT